MVGISAKIVHKNPEEQKPIPSNHYHTVADIYRNIGSDFSNKLNCTGKKTSFLPV